MSCPRLRIRLVAYGLLTVALASGCNQRLVVGAEPIPDLVTGLLAYWALEGTPLAAIEDGSGNGNHGQERSFSTTDRLPGVHGFALGFGQAGWFEVPDSPSLDSIGQALTIANWISLPAPYAPWPRAPFRLAVENQRESRPRRVQSRMAFHGNA